MKVITIGCTHAGTAAVKTMLNEYDDIEVTVYERNDTISFLSCGIALYIGEVIDDPKGLFYSNPQELEDLGATVCMEHEVLSIDENQKTITVKNLHSGDVFEDSYDKLVLATGSWPIIPKLDHLDAKNVQLCKNYKHAKAIFEKKTDAERVAVIGAGYIGVELVEAFNELGKNVLCIDGEDRVLSKYLGHAHTDILHADMEKRGIDLQLNQWVEGFEVDEDHVLTAVRTTKGTYDCDLAILCIGFHPDSSLYDDRLDTTEEGALVVDDYMYTSHPDILACGDSCAVHYNPNGGQAYIPLATNAVRMGQLVGKNIKKPQVKYRGTQSTSGLKLFGWNIGSTGVTPESAQAYGLNTSSVFVQDLYRPEFMPTNEDLYMQLVYDNDNGRVVGAQLMSRYDITQSANTLSLAIQNKMTIEDLAYVDFFFQPHFDRPWNYLNILAQAALDQYQQ